MDFPQETRDLASKIAADIKKSSGDDPFEQAKGIYSYLKGKFGYGFGEGLKQGKYIRWPHEIERQWECIEAATYTYAIAQALNRKPRMFATVGWRHTNSGHETVDVDAHGRRVLIDPLNGMFGYVGHKKEEVQVNGKVKINEYLIVEDNPLTERCILPIVGFEEVSRHQAIARIDYYRSDEGIINLLRSGQSLAHPGNRDFFVKYHPKLRALEFQQRHQPPFLEGEYYREMVFMTDEAVTNAMKERGAFLHTNWSELVGMEPFWRIEGGHTKTRVDQEFPLGNLGRTYMLSRALYGFLMQKKYPSIVSKNQEGLFLFEDRTKPLVLLSGRLGLMEEKGITMETKGSYYDLKHAYENLRDNAANEWTAEGTNRDLDFITLRMQIREEAEKEKVDRTTICRRKLGELGHDYKVVLRARPTALSDDSLHLYSEELFGDLVVRLAQKGFFDITR